ncbi:MAG: glycosyltransferase family 1 protein [Chitinophagaceae bacterium]|nr:MAG: glycosyltransferase family 1 protein [Chitinophagaceae bacterium]
MRIAIIGTRGIPNRYGGFEQISEYLSVGLAARGHEVSVYCSHRHPYKQREWKGIELIHCYDPEHLLHTAGQFIYDLNCIRHARRARFDVLLFMGYTSSSVWHFLFPRRSVIISNMDGLEWMRSKYSAPVQRFLKWAEGLAVRHSDEHIADSEVIKELLDGEYGINCRYIPYGAELPGPPDGRALETYGLQPGNYFMLMARMEPENHIETILDGFVKSDIARKMIVVGNTANGYGSMLRRKFARQENIFFPGPVFDQSVVHSLRAEAALYFHGHSVGGTNPSLLEAMASGALIAAHDNPFNRSILGPDGFYFSDAQEVADLMDSIARHEHGQRIRNNRIKIARQFNWERIVSAYNDLICAAVKQHAACPQIPLPE